MKKEAIEPSCTWQGCPWSSNRNTYVKQALDIMFPSSWLSAGTGGMTLSSCRPDESCIQASPRCQPEYRMYERTTGPCFRISISTLAKTFELLLRSSPDHHLQRTSFWCHTLTDCNRVGVHRLLWCCCVPTFRSAALCAHRSRGRPPTRFGRSAGVGRRVVSLPESLPVVLSHILRMIVAF